MADHPLQPIMLLDDDEATCYAFSRVLTRRGVPVEAFRSGTDALEYLASHPAPRLLLLDLRMPVMSGPEFLERFRADERFAHVPVLLLSGMEDVEEYAAELGAVASVNKDLEPDELVRTVLRYTEEPLPDSD